MLKVSVISKVKKGQRIVNYKIKTDDGRVVLVNADEFKKYIANGSVYVHNMTLTSDGKLVDSFRGPNKRKQEKRTIQTNHATIDKELEKRMRSIELFKQLQPGQPFTYRLVDADGTGEWKQAIYINYTHKLFYFYDGSGQNGVQAFSERFLTEQQAMEFSCSNNIPEEVARLTAKMTKTNLLKRA